MKVISAGRRTGKTEYVRLHEDKDTLVLVPNKFLTRGYRSVCTYEYYLQCVNDNMLRGCMDDPTKYNRLICEEPGLASELFRQVVEYCNMHTKTKIIMVIGTPVSYKDYFSKFLVDNQSKVVKWSILPPDNNHMLDNFDGTFEEL